MNIRRCIFAILLAALISQGKVLSVEKEPNEPEVLARLVEVDNWGEPNNSLATQLVPQSEEYIIGKPMKFGLVLKNVSDSMKNYHNGVMLFKPLIIKTPDNNCPYDKEGPYQTMEGPNHSIGAGEIVTLFENRDITGEYVIIKPGKYRIQFRGGSKLPASNIIEFEVKPGTPDERDLLIASLLDVLPDPNWQAEAPKRIRHAPAGRKETVISIFLVRGRGFLERNSVRITLWQTKSPAAVIEEQDAQASDYLGKNASGYFYIETSTEALNYWPKMKEDIAEAFKLDGSGKGSP